MEPVTHFLTGACLSRSGLNRLTGLATVTMTLAAEAPDVDILLGFAGPVINFHHHRGFTHTFLGAPVMSAAVVGAVWLGWKLWSRNGARRTKVRIRWGVLYALALLATLSHILLDYTNNYGVRPFAPFNPRWYSRDIIFIVEPVLLAVLFLAVVLPSLFGLVSSEVGSRREMFRGRGLAITALVCMVAYWLVCDTQHRTALRMLESHQMDTGATRKLGAEPYPSNPFHWFAVAETPNAYETFDVNTRSLALESLGSASTYFKPPETPQTLTAKKSYLGRVYLDWAQFPITETVPDGQETLVYLRDVRYFYSPLSSRSGTGKSTLSSHVVLGPQGRVIEQWMSNRRQD